MARLQVPEQIPSLTGPLWSLQGFQDKEKSKQTNTNHIEEEVVNKHLSPRVKLKPMPATSDRHAEGGAPQRHRQGRATKKRTSQVPKQQHTIDPEAASYSEKEVTFYNWAAVFSIVVFCCGWGSRRY